MFRLPACVLAGISKSSKGIKILACSDFTTCLFKSFEWRVNSFVTVICNSAKMYLGNSQVALKSHTFLSVRSAELDLIVPKLAVWAVEGHEDDLLEVRDPGQQQSCLSLFMAIHAQTFDDGGSFFRCEIGKDLWLLGFSLLHATQLPVRHPPATRLRFLRRHLPVCHSHFGYSKKILRDRKSVV